MTQHSSNFTWAVTQFKVAFNVFVGGVVINVLCGLSLICAKQSVFCVCVSMKLGVLVHLQSYKLNLACVGLACTHGRYAMRSNGI